MADPDPTPAPTPAPTTPPCAAYQAQQAASMSQMAAAATAVAAASPQDDAWLRMACGALAGMSFSSTEAALGTVDVFLSAYVTRFLTPTQPPA